MTAVHSLPTPEIHPFRRMLVVADFLAPFADLGARVWVAIVFWKAGLTKIVDWDTTLLLFREEYKVPLLPPAFAAFSGTAAELGFSMMLFLGLGARVAAGGLIFLTFIAQMTYPGGYHEHLVWALFLCFTLVYGPGRFAWDYQIRCLAAPDTLSPVARLSTVLSLVHITLLTLIAAHEIFAALQGFPSWLDTWNSFLARTLVTVQR